MGKKIFFSFICVFLFVQTYCQDVLHGKITQISNPCLQTPCLPGTVYAIKNDTAEYVISINNHWVLLDPLIINSDTIITNDSLTVFGVIHVKKDSLNNIYYEIEVDSATNHSTSIFSLKTNDISIYPNPSEGNFVIESVFYPINKIEIFYNDGVLFYSQTLSTNSTQVDINEKGVYFLKIELADKKIFNYKIIIR